MNSLSSSMPIGLWPRLCVRLAPNNHLCGGQVQTKPTSRVCLPADRLLPWGVPGKLCPSVWFRWQHLQQWMPASCCKFHIRLGDLRLTLPPNLSLFVSHIRPIGQFAQIHQKNHGKVEKADQALTWQCCKCRLHVAHLPQSAWWAQGDVA